jgi:hypothetical protein
MSTRRPRTDEDADVPEFEELLIRRAAAWRVCTERICASCLSAL